MSDGAEVLAALATLDGDVSEAQLQERLRVRCKVLALPYFHPYSSRRSEPGFPDAVIGRPPGRYPPPYLLLWELKRQGGRLSPHQVAWGAFLRAVCALTPALDYRVIRPADWPLVEALLYPTGGRHA